MSIFKTKSSVKHGEKSMMKKSLGVINPLGIFKVVSHIAKSPLRIFDYYTKGIRHIHEVRRNHKIDLDFEDIYINSFNRNEELLQNSYRNFAIQAWLGIAGAFVMLFLIVKTITTYIAFGLPMIYFASLIVSFSSLMFYFSSFYISRAFRAHQLKERNLFKSGFKNRMVFILSFDSALPSPFKNIKDHAFMTRSLKEEKRNRVSRKERREMLKK